MRQTLSVLLVMLIVFYGIPAQAIAQPVNDSAVLSDLLKESYVELFEKAPRLKFSSQSLKAFRKQLERGDDREEDSLKEQRRSIQDRIEQTQEELKELYKETDGTTEAGTERHALQCSLQSLRKELAETELVLDTGLEVASENRLAKLKVIEEWPKTLAEIRRTQGSNRAHERKFGDFQDVGFRSGKFEGQEKDVRTGREAVEQLKRFNLLPPEVEDETVVQYVRSVADRIAGHSDLRVPLEVTVLRSEEINAFAIPGGFLFINSGLILKADKESELAGVIAHEIAHVTARHGHRLMNKANLAGILFQTAQLASIILTGGIASIGTIYALQYGFYGLGLVLNLQLLGVSRDYETEADILGTQYLWNAGYNTKGFVSFFDKMASEFGYVTSLSWFRTHPPFFERMEETYKEIEFLPEQDDVIDDSSEFHRVKEHLSKVVSEMEKKDREAPTLRRVFDCDDVDANITED